MEVNGKYIRDENGNVVSPITNINTIYDENENNFGETWENFTSIWEEYDLEPNDTENWSYRTYSADKYFKPTIYKWGHVCNLIGSFYCNASDTIKGRVNLYTIVDTGFLPYGEVQFLFERGQSVVGYGWITGLGYDSSSLGQVWIGLSDNSAYFQEGYYAIISCSYIVC